MAPVVTRLSLVLASLLVGLYVLDYLNPTVSSYLALVPGRTLPCIWNLVTAAFLETNVIKLAIQVAALFILARIVEPAFGSKELLFFLFAVNLVTSCLVFAAVYISFMISKGEGELADLLYAEFSGFQGLSMALLVAVKQILGEHEMKLFGVLRLHIKFLPLLVLILSFGVTAFLEQYRDLPFLLLGSYTAWAYLRFFQRRQDGTIGDMSDGFKFSGFFPSFLAPIIDPLAWLLGILFFFLGLRHAAPSEAQRARSSISTTTMLGSDAADASRRRERGAKALEERIGQKSHQAQGADIEGGGQAAPTPTPSVAAHFYKGASSSGGK